MLDEEYWCHDCKALVGIFQRSVEEWACWHCGGDDVQVYDIEDDEE